MMVGTPFDQQPVPHGPELACSTTHELAVLVAVARLPLDTDGVALGCPQRLVQLVVAPDLRSEPESVGVKVTSLVQTLGDLHTIPVDDDVRMQQRHDLREILAAIRSLSRGDHLIGGGGRREADHPASELETVRPRQGIDRDRDHADRTSTLDAVRRVVEEDDLLGWQPEVGSSLQVRARSRLALAELGAIDQHVESLELRPSWPPTRGWPIGTGRC